MVAVVNRPIKLSVRAPRSVIAPSIRLPKISIGRMSFAFSRSTSPTIRAPAIRTPSNGTASCHGARVNRSSTKRAERVRQWSCQRVSSSFLGSSGGFVPDWQCLRDVGMEHYLSGIEGMIRAGLDGNLVSFDVDVVVDEEAAA
jgi:hypothetical protein